MVRNRQLCIEYGLIIMLIADNSAEAERLHMVIVCITLNHVQALVIYTEVQVVQPPRLLARICVRAISLQFATREQTFMLVG